MEKVIIGITGPQGAGKSEVAKILTQQGALHLTTRGYLQEKLKEEGKEPNRANLVEIANKIRAEHSPHYIIEQLCKKAKDAYNKIIVIESIRNIGEVQYLQNQGHTKESQRDNQKQTTSHLNNSHKMNKQKAIPKTKTNKASTLACSKQT
jgi:dephospho-CoA kinase